MGLNGWMSGVEQGRERVQVSARVRIIIVNSVVLL